MAERNPFFLRLVLAIAWPVAAWAAFPQINAWPLAFVAFAPLFWLWSVSSWKAAIGWTVLSCTIYFSLVDQWMIFSLGDEIGNARFLALILLSFIESLFVALGAVVVSLAARGAFRAPLVIAAPAAWLIMESVRTNGEASMPFAQVGAIAPHVAWLLPMAAYAGIYGLTALIVLCNGAIAGLVFGDRSARVAGLATLGIVVVVVALGDAGRQTVALPPAHTRVAIAQGNISQRVKWSPARFTQTIATYSALTSQAAAGGARIVVWPETAITDYPLEKPELFSELQALVGQQQVWLIAGTVDSPTPHETYNIIMTLDPQGTLRDVYRKHILVPFAEYLPFDAIFRRIPGFDQASAFTHGLGPQLLHVEGNRFGPLICFESAYSSYARQTVLLGATSLLVITDDAWFGSASGPVIHADLSAIDAVETGRWVVRGADTGISQFIDPKGRVVAQLPLNTQGVLSANIGAPIDTPYLRFGAGWLEALALCALVIAAVWRPAPAKRQWR
ncbi:MAG: apolipoprotein N-acyltransferase [Candidatus Eremiobacteraeota bacterium]|nr:apolipoprotein N-acyltransferase [Candidatus Eremiobacteraeota bacterium]